MLCLIVNTVIPCHLSYMGGIVLILKLVMGKMRPSQQDVLQAPHQVDVERSGQPGPLCRFIAEFGKSLVTWLHSTAASSITPLTQCRTHG